MKKEIVYTDKYALILSDEEIKEGDWIKWDGKCLKAVDTSYLPTTKKIIAHLPLSDAPILEGVPLLPSFSWSQQDDVYEMAQEYAIKSHSPNREARRKGFVDGYNKAKEKYKYTEEDVRRAIEMGTEIKGDAMDYMFFTDDEIIERLQQPSRPTHFECEMEITHEGNGTYSTDLMDIGVSNLVPINIPKTTTNSQGQIELVGKYI